MRIVKEQTCGLIIDIQEKLYPHIRNFEVLSRNNITLIQGLKILNIPVLLTQQYTKGLGETIPGIRELINEINPVEKNSFSCCDEPSFMDALKRLGKRNVVIAGIEAHVCVLQTTLDLLKLDYIPVIIEDCISSRKKSDKKIALERMRQEGAIISTYESILFELTRFARTDEFKQISRLVK
jgi:nicotinamidase-related amidase